MEKEDKIANPALLAGALVLFLISLAFVFFNIKKGGNEEVSQTENESVVENIDVEDTSLSKYFEKNGSNVLQSEDAFKAGDPFREQCEGGGDGKKPYVVSGTVCYY